MRFLAELISPNKIAVWFFDSTDALFDGKYTLKGRVKWPLFPVEASFEFDVGHEDYFLIQDYDQKCKEWREKTGYSAGPFEWQYVPSFSGGNDSRLFQQLIGDENIELCKQELTKKIKTNIIEWFATPEEENFRYTHCVYKTLVLGTVS